MFEQMSALPIAWLAIIGLAIAMYVILDGFTLGIGILFPFFKGKENRDIMMGTASPVWDGNQTWMILAGAGLYGAFPLVYATILPALYLPLVLMLLALIFRGIAFEFRAKSTRYRHMFDIAFSGGALVATFAEGIVLGGIIHGLNIDLDQRHFAGGVLDWLTPFSIFTGFALICGYALLGASWMVVKTEGAIQRRAYNFVRPLCLLVLLAMAVVAIWTPIHNVQVFERWSTVPGAMMMAVLAIIAIVLCLSIISGIGKRKEHSIFAKVIGLFLVGLAGLLISFFPVIIPPNVTIFQAASSEKSQFFLIVGYLVIIPLVLGYTVYSYYVFRGKVRAESLSHY